MGWNKSLQYFSIGGIWTQDFVSHVSEIYRKVTFQWIFQINLCGLWILIVFTLKVKRKMWCIYIIWCFYFNKGINTHTVQTTKYVIYKDESTIHKCFTWFKNGNYDPDAWEFSGRHDKVKMLIKNNPEPMISHKQCKGHLDKM